MEQAVERTRYTCLACRVAFPTLEMQREHYKDDWHRYNLKRKTAGMAPVTHENFKQRVLAQRERDLQTSNALAYTGNCETCGKSFSSSNAYENHLNSKKHKELQAKVDRGEIKPKSRRKQQDESTLNSPALEEPVAAGAPMSPPEDANEKDLENYLEKAERLTPEDCLFCSHKSKSFEANMEHMTVAHSLFIPDMEYNVDLQGLIAYLAEKITIGHMCIFCNTRGKTFYSTEAVRKHMTDKGHCKMYYEGDDAAVEYQDFYDFSSSYPDGEVPETATDGALVAMDTDDTEAVTGSGIEMSEDATELILPNGSRIGHRSLQRYYKQKFRPEEDRERLLRGQLIAKYRSLGWYGAGNDVAKRASFRYANDSQKHRMQVGVKANKLQTYFRPQVLF